MDSFQDMTLNQFKIILSHFPTANYINLQGNGEPFLNKDIFDMIIEAKKKDRYVLTSTNATLLNGELNQKILESGLDKLVISIVATDSAVYDKLVHGADFQKIKANIALLTELKKTTSRPHPRIVFTSGFLKLNIESLRRLPSLARELGLDEIEIGPFHGVDLYMPEICDIMKTIADMEKSSSRERIRLIIHRNQFERNYRAKECLWPWQGIYITVGGDIKPCCSRAYYSDLKFGNIYKDNFQSIWHGKGYLNFRKGLSGRGPLPAICRGCPWD